MEKETGKLLKPNLSKALIIAEKTGVDSKFSPAVFKYLQTDRATINNEKDIRNIFVLSGGDAKKFDQGMKNFSIIGQAKREKKIQDKLRRLQSDIESYETNIQFFKLSKGSEDFLNDINKKIEKAHKGIDSLKNELKVIRKHKSLNAK